MCVCFGLYAKSAVWFCPSCLSLTVFKKYNYFQKIFCKVATNLVSAWIARWKNKAFFKAFFKIYMGHWKCLRFTSRFTVNSPLSCGSIWKQRNYDNLFCLYCCTTLKLPTLSGVSEKNSQLNVVSWALKVVEKSLNLMLTKSVGTLFLKHIWSSDSVNPVIRLLSRHWRGENRYWTLPDAFQIPPQGTLEILEFLPALLKAPFALLSWVKKKKKWCWIKLKTSWKAIHSSHCVKASGIQFLKGVKVGKCNCKWRVFCSRRADLNQDGAI